MAIIEAAGDMARLEFIGNHEGRTRKDLVTNGASLVITIKGSTGI